jgi:hypothetical protein
MCYKYNEMTINEPSTIHTKKLGENIGAIHRIVLIMFRPMKTPLELPNVKIVHMVRNKFLFVKSIMTPPCCSKYFFQAPRTIFPFNC